MLPAKLEPHEDDDGPPTGPLAPGCGAADAAPPKAAVSHGRTRLRGKRSEAAAALSVKREARLGGAEGGDDEGVVMAARPSANAPASSGASAFGTAPPAKPPTPSAACPPPPKGAFRRTASFRSSSPPASPRTGSPKKRAAETLSGDFGRSPRTTWSAKIDLEGLLVGDRYLQSPGKFGLSSQSVASSPTDKTSAAKGEPEEEGSATSDHASAATTQSSSVPATNSRGSAAEPQEHDAAEVDQNALADMISEDMPINEYSLEQKFPNGSMFCSIGRIRGTLNKYADHTTKIRWYDNFMPPTMSALLRRLQKYRSQVHGHIDIDIHIGFRQLVARLAALMLLYRSLKQWSDSKDLDALLRTITPLAVLERYMVATSQKLAPDLQVLRQCALYQQAANTRSLNQAVDALCLKDFLEWHAAITTAAGDIMVDAAQSADGEDKEHDDGASGREVSAVARKSKRRRKYDYSIPTVSQELFAPPIMLLCKLVAGSLKRVLYGVPAGILTKPAEIERLIGILMPALSSWRAVVAGHMGAADFIEVFDVVCTVCECAWDVEGRKPRATVVRIARKVLLGTLKLTGPVGDVGKAMASGSYEGTNEIMESARAHAAAGLEDEASNQRFEAGWDRFEAQMGSGAYDDLGKWVQTANGGDRVDAAFMSQQLLSLGSFCNDLWGCVDRWSNAALLEKQSELDDAFGNARVVLDVAVHTMLLHVHDFVGFCLPALLAVCDVAVVPLADSVLCDKKAVTADGAIEGGRTEGRPDAESGNPTTRDSTLSVTAQSVVESRMRLRDFANRLLEHSKHLVKLMHRTMTRLGEDEDRKSAIAGIDDLGQSVELNKEAIDKLYAFFAAWVFLASHEPRSDGIVFEKLEIQSQYMGALTDFCKFYHMFGEAPFTTTTCPEYGGAAVLASLQQSIGKFIERAGAAMYAQHAQECLEAWVGHIAKVHVQVASIHTAVVEQAQVTKLLPLLILVPTVRDLRGKGDIALTGKDDDDRNVFLDDKHNKALRCLMHFVDKVKVGHLHIAGVQKVNDDDQENSELMPAEYATQYLKVACLVYDITRLSSALHDDFLIPCADSNTLDSTKVFGYVSFLLRVFQVLLADLEGEINAATALELEAQGWRLPLGLGLVREWRHTMSLFAGKVQTKLVMTFVSVLDDAVERCRQAIPSWEAGMDNDRLDESVLRNMMADKQTTLIARHNEVHEVMELMNYAAVLLHIQPPLQENDMSKQSILVALNTLGRASTACTVSTGIAMLERYRADPAGPTKAKRFISSHRSAHPSIPDKFWQLFEDIVCYSAPALATPGAVPPPAQAAPASSATGGVKVPPSDRDEISAAGASTGEVRGAASNAKPREAVALKRRRRNTMSSL